MPEGQQQSPHWATANEEFWRLGAKGRPKVVGDSS